MVHSRECPRLSFYVLVALSFLWLLLSGGLYNYLEKKISRALNKGVCLASESFSRRR